jgi:hypothetical protein
MGNFRPRRTGGTVLVIALQLAILTGAHGQQQPGPSPLRPPATPLITHDPYFSIWSKGDRLTDNATRHWTDVPQELNGLIRVDNHNYRFLGNANRAIPPLAQVSSQVTPTRTIVTLTSPEIELKITFLTPAFPEDLDVLARPVTYLTWNVTARDGKKHQVEIFLDAAGTLATNDPGEEVVWSHGEVDGLHLLRIGTKDQPVLQRFGDNVRINWGYFYFAVPDNQGDVELTAGNERHRQAFIDTGNLPQDDDLGGPRTPQSNYPAAPTLDVDLHLGEVGATPVSRHILLAYDDIDSVEYMNRRLLPYWRKNISSFAQLLKTAEHEYPVLSSRSVTFDAALEADLVKAGGPEYAAVAVLAFRQAIAAHKLVEDVDGTPFFMPKENFSNGSISTVDVIYPSAPMFLLLNPKLAEAQLEPVLRYAEMPRWKFPFAPHDLGVYPLANGQQYGGGEETEVNQMPVEESGDIILLVAAIEHAEGNVEYARRYWPLLTKWAEYLESKGLDPENQLSTDDFAGHLAHNANLSIKAIEAIGAYANLARELGHDDVATRYQNTAHHMAAQWIQMAQDGDHYRLAFDKPGTWSQKYNLAWDRILGLNLFPDSVASEEITFYKQHLNTYGLPIDNRATYTKLDWEVWTATLANNQDDFETLVHPIFKFLNETPDRVPMTDWYDTVSGRMRGFRARSVVGGVYIKMLADSGLWQKWAKETPAAP